MILVIDFGGQTAHLISRRIKQLGVESKLILPEDALSEIKSQKPAGIILSGGPMSVYEAGVPSMDKKILEMGIPILGICYGFQLVAYLLGGKVVSGRKEYGPASLRITNYELQITNKLPQQSVVWMNHGDEIVNLPKDFVVVGETENVPFTFSVSTKRNIYGILFHPEVEHTEYGMQILQNFVSICNSNVILASRNAMKTRPGSLQNKKDSGQVKDALGTRMTYDPKQMIKKIKEEVGGAHVIGAISGGVDSTVAGTLVAKAIGKQFTPIFVDNGLMREDAQGSVEKAFKSHGVTPVIVHCEKEMLKRLKGVTDSEEKRKVIGKFYIEIFEREVQKLLKSSSDGGPRLNRGTPPRLTLRPFLLQGTIYSDVIESQGTKHASKIKSHHNVGGLPKTMKLKLLEPLRDLYKDEVRMLGRALGLPEEFVMKQPFPGPGFAVRIRGEVTEKRLQQEKHADRIVLEELKAAGWLDKIFISFPVMTDAFSTAVKGDGKFFGEVIALRIVESLDVMTATWSRVPYGTLQRISSRIVNEVPEISRVVYDISTKPPATMEWE